MTEPLPLTVIGGPLGAGKTTLVNALLAGGHGLSIAVIVNDFGAVALDHDLIVNRSGETLVLANGCLCCTAGADLWDTVNRVLELEPRPDHLVIETSGVSDPARTARIALADPQISGGLVVTVADAANLAALTADPAIAPVTRAQIAAAHLFVLSKTDIVSRDTVSAAVRLVGSINPQAPVVTANHGVVPPDLLLDAPPAEAPRKAGAFRTGPANHGAVFSSWSWSGPDAVSETALKGFATDTGLGIYRIKGVVIARDGSGVMVHRAGETLAFEPCGRPPVGRIAVIGWGPHFNEARIQAAWDRVLSASL